MPLKYFPLTRIKKDLYTRGNQFITPDGKFYVGKYYKTFDDKAYVGANPVVGTNVELREVKLDIEHQNIGRTPTLETETYTVVAENPRVVSDGLLEELVPYYPIPIPSDYQQGYFLRYFAKNVTGPQYVVEISQIDYSLLEQNRIAPNILSYQYVSMLWQLTGPLRDKRVSQYQIIGGVFDTNKRVTENTQKGFRGIEEFIGGDYTKFAKITPD